MMDNYRKGWALRYLREAKAEIIAAQKMPYLAVSLILEGIRKAQAAIYYSLGDPNYIRALVHQTVYEEKLIEEPILKFLVEIERTIQQLLQMPELNRERAINQANALIQMASDIVKLFIDEKA